MKKLLHMAMLFLLPLLTEAQVLEDSISQTQYACSPVVRKGNTYIVGDMRMGIREYRGYLKNTCPEAYGQFDRGYKTAMAGWGLFAGGYALVGVSTPIWFVSSFWYDPNNTPAQEHHRRAVWGSSVGLMCLGGVSFFSGIVCLSVGYGQMHHTARHLNCETTTYWTIENRANEIGLAWHF